MNFSGWRFLKTLGPDVAIVSSTQHIGVTFDKPNYHPSIVVYTAIGSNETPRVMSIGIRHHVGGLLQLSPVAGPRGHRPLRLEVGPRLADQGIPHALRG
eukprot:1354315-Pyramimonas_sp.AAC.1